MSSCQMPLSRAQLSSASRLPSHLRHRSPSSRERCWWRYWLWPQAFLLPLLSFLPICKKLGKASRRSLLFSGLRVSVSVFCWGDWGMVSAWLRMFLFPSLATASRPDRFDRWLILPGSPFRFHFIDWNCRRHYFRSIHCRLREWSQLFLIGAFASGARFLTYMCSFSHLSSFLPAIAIRLHTNASDYTYSLQSRAECRRPTGLGPVVRGCHVSFWAFLLYFPDMLFYSQWWAFELFSFRVSIACHQISSSSSSSFHFISFKDAQERIMSRRHKACYHHRH